MTQKISVIVPVFNERENLETLIPALLNGLEAAGEDFEVVFVDDGSWSLEEHFAFHFHVDFYVYVGRVDVGVAQPAADHVDVVACPQQMHGCCMADGVWIDGFGPERWALALSGGGIFLDDVANAEACDRDAVGVEEQRFGCWVFGGTQGDVILDCVAGFRP